MDIREGSIEGNGSPKTRVRRGSADDALETTVAPTVDQVAELLNLDVTNEAHARALEVLEVAIERPHEVADLADHAQGFVDDESHILFELGVVKRTFDKVSENRRAGAKKFASLLEYDGPNRLQDYLRDPEEEVGKVDAIIGSVDALLFLLRVSSPAYAALDPVNVLALFWEASKSLSDTGRIRPGAISHVQILAELMHEVGLYGVQDVEHGRRRIKAVQKSEERRKKEGLPPKQFQPSTFRILRAYDANKKDVETKIRARFEELEKIRIAAGVSLEDVEEAALENGDF